VVPSEKNTNVTNEDHIFYTVNGSLGTCICDDAKSGQFCKQQAVVCTQCGAWMQSMPPTSSEDCHQMAVLALSECAENVSFYADIRQPIETPSIESSDKESKFFDSHLHISRIDRGCTQADSAILGTQVRNIRHLH
jgi:hypothetical protein